jgi:hypothetical protein
MIESRRSAALVLCVCSDSRFSAFMLPNLNTHCYRRITGITAVCCQGIRAIIHGLPSQSSISQTEQAAKNRQESACCPAQILHADASHPWSSDRFIENATIPVVSERCSDGPFPATFARQ